jgi:hypothetical protein
MIETKCNYKVNYKNNLKCEICKIKDGNTEHLILSEYHQIDYFKLI